MYHFISVSTRQTLEAGRSVRERGWEVMDKDIELLLKTLRERDTSRGRYARFLVGFTIFCLSFGVTIYLALSFFVAFLFVIGILSKPVAYAGFVLLMLFSFLAAVFSGVYSVIAVWKLEKESEKKKAEGEVL
jgi:uncharacterized membrane protein (DUF485 family)